VVRRNFVKRSNVGLTARNQSVGLTSASQSLGPPVEQQRHMTGQAEVGTQVCILTNTYKQQVRFSLNKIQFQISEPEASITSIRDGAIAAVRYFSEIGLV